MRNKLILMGFVIVVLSLSLALLGCEQQRADGTYVGYSEANARGYAEATVTIEDEKIVAVELVEYDGLGEVKGEDYRLDKFHEAMEILPERFIENNTYEVDVVSGATSTSNKAMEAVEMALKKADGETEFEGTFMGVSEPSARNAWGIAWVTVEDGNITDIRLEESANGELKDEDYSLDEFHEAKEELPARMIEANSYDVDSYSGATGSSNMWKEAVKEALEKAGLN